MRAVVAVSLLALAIPLAAHAACKVGLEPFSVTMAGPRPMISGTINGQSVRFVADSGAVFSVLSPAVAAELKLRLGMAPINLRMTGIGGDFTPTVTTVRKLSIDGIDVADVQFLVGGGEAGDGAAGILGQNFWHIADVEYDLGDGVIRLARPQGCGNRPLAYWAGAQHVSAMDLLNSPQDVHGTYGYAFVNGKRIKVAFDTGASYSYLSFAAARAAGLDPEGPGTVADGAIEGVGRKTIRTRVAPVDIFQIGDEKIEHTHLRLAETTLPDEDMLLGADFFLSHRVYVANRQGRIYFTYNGGPVFDLGGPRGDTAAPSPPPIVAPPPAPEPAADPTAASEIGRRGAAELGRLEYGPALADLIRAHDLAPRNPEYLYQMALARLGVGKPYLALANLDDALSLAPDDVDARIVRAQLRLAFKQPKRAEADLRAASMLLASQADARFGLGSLYVDAADYHAAAAQFDMWIKAHPNDARLAMAFNGRCWAGAMGGDDLAGALKACDDALRREPHNPTFLDSRGLVFLRLGDLDKALVDYGAALARDPKIAWALYGRGLIELKQGQATPGHADIAAATALDAKLPDQARRLGIAPP